MASLLETGSAAKLRQAAINNGEIRVISYNIRWRSGENLKKLIRLFREDPEIGNAAVMGLQEVDRQKKRSEHTNTVKQMADELGLHYAWAAPPTAKVEDEEETGVAILSVYPLSDIRRIVLPHEGPNQRRRVALGATVNISGTEIRIYSVHGETRIALEKKLEQMNAVLQDLSHYRTQMPAIVLGDLNTWEANAGRRTIKLFTDAGFQTPFGDQTTFYRRIVLLPIEFRLDWIWLRGLQASGYGIDREIDISDHRPLWTIVKVQSEKSRVAQ
jgi:endonuclease/exonuclease/phosphatase family metal-dependent hydrolase